MSTGLFIGRFQPFHKGHKKCVEYILENHDKCVIAVRDTNVDKNNPLTFAERLERIRSFFPDENKVKIIKIPDIDVAYIGRKVGYGLIQLDPDTESISATDIRRKLYGNQS